jgi:hypothetical protein
MTFPNDQTLPPVPDPESRISARARRRRARRTLFPKDAQGRAAILGSLAKRAYPSYELFVYSLVCGAVLGVGYIFDSYSVLLLGILFAPLMAPWVGFVLSIISGTPRLFIQTLAGLLVSALLVLEPALWLAWLRAWSCRTRSMWPSPSAACGGLI